MTQPQVPQKTRSCSLGRLPPRHLRCEWRECFLRFLKYDDRKQATPGLDSLAHWLLCDIFKVLEIWQKPRTDPPLKPWGLNRRSEVGGHIGEFHPYQKYLHFLHPFPAQIWALHKKRANYSLELVSKVTGSCPHTPILLFLYQICFNSRQLHFPVCSAQIRSQLLAFRLGEH